MQICICRISVKTKIGDITKIRTGKLDANAADENGKYPFFTCSKEPLKINTYSYDCECVLVAGNGDLNVKYYNGKFDAYQRTYIIEDDSDGLLFMPYLYFFMESYIDELRKQSIGGVIKYIKLKNLTDALIELPSIEVQRKIVNIISKSKEIVRRKENEFELLDELVRARFVEMFGNPANNPYNFSKMKLGKICDVRDGTHDSPKYQTVGYPLITSKNLTSGEIDFSNCNYIKEEDYKKINLRSEVTRGDIIMPMIGTIGNPIIVNTDIRFAIKNVALIKFNNNTLQNIYVKYFLGSDYFDFSVLRNIRGGTQKFIALKDLRDLDILVPPLELQNQFASFVQEIDKSRLLSNHLLFLIKSISSNH